MRALNSRADDRPWRGEAPRRGARAGGRRAMGGTEQRPHDEWPNLDKPGNADAGDQAGGTGDAHKGEITEELQELGQQLAATARAAWQSEQRQELQREITDGVRLLRE